MANYVKHFNIAGNIIDVRDEDAYSKIIASPFVNVSDHVLNVGSSAQFSSINDAITYARNESWNDVIIFITTGIYNESIILNDNAITVTLIGIGDVTITSNAVYPDGVLYCANTFTAWNIAFRATDTSNSAAYAFHHEQAAADYGNSIVFHDCKFYAANNSAAGLGIGNSNIYFYECEFSNGDPTRAALYAHNAATGSGKTGNLFVKNCRIYGILQLDDCEAQYGGANILNCTFVNNSGVTNFVYYDYVDYYTFFQPISNHYTRLSTESTGNNRTALNYATKDRAPLHYQGISYHSGDVYVPFPNPNKYTNFRLLYSEPAGIVVNSINSNKIGNIQLNGTFPAAGTPILLSMEFDPC